MTPTAAFDHHDAGTDARTWDALNPAELPPVRIDRYEHLVVVAAHPDDETLGVGGLLHRFAAEGGAVTLVMATDGEGSHPDSPTMPPDRMAEVRRQEILAAVAVLAPAATVIRLQIPDGEVTAHQQVLADRLDRLVDSGTLVVSPWQHDRHPDHEAAAIAAARVAARHGLTHLSYPIWGWHWGRPTDPEFDRGLMQRVTLPAASRTAKAVALSRYRSQILPLSTQPGDEPVLSRAFLEHFDRSDEILFRTPAPPCPRTLEQSWFDEFYRQGPDPWGFVDRWYEQRKRAVLLASLPRPRFRSAFEPGCSIGVLTAELAPRCEKLLAADISTAPLAQARERVGDADHVVVEQRVVPDDWPPDRFDLVVLSEIGYYLDETDLRRLATRVRDSLDEDGVVVLCHWRHPVEGYPLTGDRTHEILREELDLRAAVQHVEADFRLEVLVAPGVPAVAAAEGLR